MSERANHRVAVHDLHEAHPRIRAADWRAPLVARILDETAYADGHQTLAVSYRDATGSLSEGRLELEWADMADDYGLCINTYQETVLTEFAALAVACILCDQQEMEITEVTRRGEKVDYWLGDREALLEVSGTKGADLGELCERKATQQLKANPLGKDGFVCVARFNEPAARLWHYARES